MSTTLLDEYGVALVVEVVLLGEGNRIYGGGCGNIYIHMVRIKLCKQIFLYI